MSYDPEHFRPLDFVYNLIIENWNEIMFVIFTCFFIGLLIKLLFFHRWNAFRSIKI
jgi:hypothetical protein